ncbi:MAG: GNAT family N-acetyltransferase [Eubacteriales bacterium]|nr:GNAT family N-acetyltransferase [Eubacteriales bacterium]
MRVEDLTSESEKLYCVCLEDWSEDIKEAGKHKEKWYQRMKDKGLGVKIARDDNDEIGGMIQYIPIEHSFVDGKDLYLINCIWVHGHKQGRGNFQKKGLGKALLAAAEEDVKARGAKGIVAWGLMLPFFMRASWFKKQGYKPIDRLGLQVLLWKPFNEEAIPPKWIKQKKKPVIVPGKVTVTAFINGWCPAQNIAFERAKRASAEFGDKVVFQEYGTYDRETFLEWGLSDVLFVDGKQIRTGPPPTYESIKRIIEKKVKKLNQGTVA